MLSVNACMELACDKLVMKECAKNLKPVCSVSGRTPKMMQKCPKGAF
jgi:hypothetical protein